MGTRNIVLVAGARPNFMKIAPLVEAIKRAQSEGKAISYSLVHTGQHYDANMSKDFFVELNIPEPDTNLEAGGGTQAEQTAAIMVRFEQYLVKNQADLVIVVGDVTSTLACTIVARKSGIPVAHIEGGIRSGDMTMPEEINRIVTDSIANFFFTTSKTANENLIREGKLNESIFFVGNTMIDTLLGNLKNLRKPDIWKKLNLSVGGYFVVTLHRPVNVDNKEQLTSILEAIESSAGPSPVLFPVHPRTLNNIRSFGIQFRKVHMVDPMGYLEFNYLVKHAKGVITDSGGITEEATVLGIPCMTLRDSTERPETCTVGTNELLGTDPARIKPTMEKLMSGRWKKGGIPELWDGHAAERIVRIITDRILK